jgi:hypothetical protein
MTKLARLHRFLFVLGSAALAAGTGFAQEKSPVHAVVDIGHEFSFYGDGRFHRQYLPDQPAVTSWGSLFNFDFSNANLLVLLGCEPHITYWPEDIDAINTLLSEGGGVVLLGHAESKAQNDLARTFGCSFGEPAKKPLKAMQPVISGEIVGGGSTLNLRQPKSWEVLIADADGKPVLARRTIGKGTLLVGARRLAGQQPDARDDINASWWKPLLVATAAGKQVSASQPFRGRGIDRLDYTEKLDSLLLHYSDYTKPYAKAMGDIYKRCVPVIEKRMGVPLSAGMASEIGLLATGGGGFSSGKMLGLAVFWGGFPEREDSMIEFITHESVHSWVLPFPEVWNEPIATYVGNLAMIDMGYREEAERRIKSCIERASRIDPTMKLYDLSGNGPASARKLTGGEVNNIHWGKTFWIFEELRKENPQVVADYFQAKRRLAKQGEVKRYDMSATVAVMSVAMKKDMFPWFKEHGFDVDAAKSPIPLKLN